MAFASRRLLQPGPMLSHEKKLMISPQSIKRGILYAEMQDCHAVSHVDTSMMDASRLADSRRAEYGDEDMANSVRAVGTSSPDTGVAASAVLVLARKSAGIAMLQSLSARHLLPGDGFTVPKRSQLHSNFSLLPPMAFQNTAA